jgi:DHA1 family tetracycline resistance protein-like MFS transporter
MNRALVIILSTVVLSAVGIGLTMPIIPQLMRDVGHTTELGWKFGAFTGLYALMQFIFSPILGVLSDRFGRRPILLLSLAGAVVIICSWRWRRRWRCCLSAARLPASPAPAWR